jgi:thymidylate synthase (FAD)
MNKGDSFKVYDGYVKLVDWMGDDNTPLVSARMSTNNPTGVDVKKDDALRDRLLYDLHTSPFQGQQLVIEMELPIFCLRQFERHRTLSECDIEVVELDENWRKYHNRNEFSGRYSQMPDKYYIPELEDIHGQSTVNKQTGVDWFGHSMKETVQSLIKSGIRDIRNVYDTLIENKVSNELARVVLPSAQQTRVQYVADILNWAKCLALRVKPDVQPQTVKYAKTIEHIVEQVFPKTYPGLADHIIYAEKVSKSEFDLIKDAIDIKRLRQLCIEGRIDERRAKRLFKKLGLE